MEINLHEAVIHVLDTKRDLYQPSPVMDSYSEAEENLLKSRARKAMSADKRVGFLDGDENNNALLYTYEEGRLGEIAETLGELYFNLKKKEGIYETTDLFLIDFRAEDSDYLLIMDSFLKSCITNRFDPETGVNHLAEYDTVVSREAGKEDRFLLYDYRSQLVYVYDREGENGGLLSERLFAAASEPTATEVVHTMEKNIRSIAEKYEMPIEEKIPEFRSILMEAEVIEPEHVAEVIFPDQPAARMEFTGSLHNEGMKEASIPREQLKLAKKDRTMKFITESGIEVIIPANFLKQKDKVEIITNPDGTSSIAIKNITQLRSK